MVLLSGGVESAVLLYYRQQGCLGRRLCPLFINYGQRAWAQEQYAAAALCQSLGLPLKVFDMSLLGAAFQALQAPVRQHVPVPHRNLLLLSVASAYAAQVGAAQCALSLIADDLSAYSSTSPSFLHHMDAALQALDPPVQLLTPLLSMSKAQVVAQGAGLGVPWHLTFSCMAGRVSTATAAAAAAASVGGLASADVSMVRMVLRHCGRCSQCRARRAAFAEAGVAEDGVHYNDIEY